MTVKATWDNIELTDKGSTVNNDLKVWEACGWLPKQLIEHGLARVTQPVFIDGAEYLLKDSSGHGDATRVRYEIGTNTFYEVGKPFGFSAPASDFGKHFTVELVVESSESPETLFGDKITSTVDIKVEPTDEETKKWLAQQFGRADRVNSRQYPRNKYDREILPGVHVDVYDVLAAFITNSAAIDHAVKKLLAPGQRGVKDRVTDLKEAVSSIQREIDRIGEWSDRAAGGQISKGFTCRVSENGFTTKKFKPSHEDGEQ